MDDEELTHIEELLRAWSTGRLEHASTKFQILKNKTAEPSCCLAMKTEDSCIHFWDTDSKYFFYSDF